MPVHNWSDVDANVYHHFHQRWTTAICDALNAGLLPPGYSALVEQHAAGLIPDVLTVARRTRGKGRGQPQGGAVTAVAPQARHHFQARAALAARGNRVVIRHRLGDVVCVLEVVSPGNKSTRAALKALVAKAADFLRHGVHLVVIDLLPPTPRDPHGVHRAIWKAVAGDDSFQLPTGKALTLAAYVAGDAKVGRVVEAHVQPVAVEQALPDMPAYLTGSDYVPVPLEAAYQAAWATCPADMRHLVETGKLPDEQP